MTAPGAAEAQYSYPALGGGLPGAAAEAPAPLPPAHVGPVLVETRLAQTQSADAQPAQTQPSVSVERAALDADAMVRGALARGPLGRGLSGGGPPLGFAALVEPGIVPLRPLSLIEIYNGAVALIRFNSKAVLGFSAVVLGVGALLQVAVLAPVLRWTMRNVFDFGEAASPDSSDSKSTISLLDTVIAAPISLITTTLIVGVAIVVLAGAVLGERIPAREVWRRVRRRIGALIGLICVMSGVQVLVVLVPVVVIGGLITMGLPAVLGVLLLVLVVPLCLLVAYLLGTFLSLAAPAMMWENLDVFEACARSWRLVSRGFWKILGVNLLTGLLVGVIAYSLAFPFSVAGQVFTALSDMDEKNALLAVVLLTVGELVSKIVLTPFTAGVTGLLYVDQRMRQEAYDLVLLGKAESLAVARRGAA